MRRVAGDFNLPPDAVDIGVGAARAGASAAPDKGQEYWHQQGDDEHYGNGGEGHSSHRLLNPPEAATGRVRRRPRRSAGRRRCREGGIIAVAVAGQSRSQWRPPAVRFG